MCSKIDLPDRMNKLNKEKTKTKVVTVLDKNIQIIRGKEETKRRKGNFYMLFNSLPKKPQMTKIKNIQQNRKPDDLGNCFERRKP